MKRKIVVAFSALLVSLIMACNGDHSAKGGRDTAQAKHEVPSNVDTSTPTSTTGDASAVDNSASGGTKIKKADSLKMDSAHN